MVIWNVGETDELMMTATRAGDEVKLTNRSPFSSPLSCTELVNEMEK